MYFRAHGVTELSKLRLKKKTIEIFYLTLLLLCWPHRLAPPAVQISKQRLYLIGVRHSLVENFPPDSFNKNRLYRQLLVSQVMMTLDACMVVAIHQWSPGCKLFSFLAYYVLFCVETAILVTILVMAWLYFFTLLIESQYAAQ